MNISRIALTMALGTLFALTAFANVAPTRTLDACCKCCQTCCCKTCNCTDNCKCGCCGEEA